MALSLFALHAWCAEITVKTSGGDYDSIQDAIDNSSPGDTVTVYVGTYYERVEIFNSLTLRTHSNDLVYINGSNRHVASTPHMIGIYGGVNDLTIQGFNICSNRADSNNGGSGIFIEDYGRHIQFLNNIIYDMLGTAGMGITVYGTDENNPISNIVISGNVIFDCEPADSEALVLNGNVTHFTVTSNEIRDVNNIGIDFIGGETDINPSKVARNGVCADNRVLRARSSYGGGYAAGIYVDGGCNIVIERNIVRESDMGIEIGAENQGWNTTNIVVRSNVLAENDKIGIVFGGYESNKGRVLDCRFYNNTLYKNANTSDWQGEIIVNWSSNCVVENNIIFVSERGDGYAVLDGANSGNASNLFDYNLYYSDEDATNVLFEWKNVTYDGFTQYQAAVLSNEAHSFCADPSFSNPSTTNLRLNSNSPAIDQGNPSNRPTPVTGTATARCAASTTEPISAPTSTSTWNACPPAP